ncbi:TRAP transporter small permease [Ramlibacter algicola]|uniref:TRAP transporter small permease protein n=1 Tax=Ramlibacter algicola TaxID=2795217 RepID=A0A934UQ09_9BURK|nr:TRAP transporter small permease [Ramlibacter algicola]MBK0392124.1 TRAP transporter small permease [Ramlibacter algicola]
MTQNVSGRVGAAVLAGLDTGLCAICAATIVAFSVMLIAQVGLRQIGEPLFWIEEVCQYLMVYLCFLGTAIAWGRREHLVVDFLPSLLPDTPRKVLTFAVDAVVLVFAAWAAWASAEFALYSMRKISISLEAPVGYGYLGAPIGFAIVSLQSLIFMVCGEKGQVLSRQPELEEVGM